MISFSTSFASSSGATSNEADAHATRRYAININAAGRASCIRQASE